MFTAVIQKPVHRLCRSKVHYHIHIFLYLFKRGIYREILLLFCIQIHSGCNHHLGIFLCQAGNDLSHGSITAMQ